MPGNFHFLHPVWLLALIPLAALLWWMRPGQSGTTAWSKVIDPNLLPLLLQGKDNHAGKTIKWLLGIGWLIGVVALADPVWDKVPRPVFQTNSARIIVLDLSNSMLVDDLKPSRLARARFKIEDILSREDEGQVGLVVFAGDAFTAAPLTRDSDTIRSLLKVLKPQIMPSQGSRVDLGLKKAHELLKQAGVNNGQVLLIADGVSHQQAAIEAAKSLANDGHTVSVLGVGTEQGGTLRFSDNQSVTVKLNADALREIARAGGGRFHQITSNNADLKSVVLKKTTPNQAQEQLKNNDLKSQDWKSTGPFLIFLLLPLAALAFRKGWLLNIMLSVGLLGLYLQPQPVMAASWGESLNNKWEQFWKNKEQLADEALRQQQYDKASELAKDPLRRGSAEYKKGDYQSALQEFQKIKGADARYNEGNALAKLKKYKEAIAAYEQALKQVPDMKDAKMNKKAIEELLKKQQQAQQQAKQSDQNKDQKQQAGSKQNQQQQAGTEQKKQNQQQQAGSQNQNQNQKQQQQAGDSKDKQQNHQKNASSKSQQGKKKDPQSQAKGGSDKPPKNKKDQSGNQFKEASKQLEKQKKQSQTEANKPKKEAQKGNNQAGQGSEKEKEKESPDKKLAEKGNNKASDKKNQRQRNNKKGAQQTKNTQGKESEKPASGTKAEADQLTTEEKMAAEQWLRRIPDDPGGLLRRKFLSQYQRRSRQQNNTENPW